MPQPNCQSIRYCWEAEKVKTLIRLRAELSPLFTGKRNAAKYAWAVVERELNVPLPLAKIIKKWNNLLQEYKAIKLSEEPKRRDWPFFNMMDVYFSDQVNDPTLRLFSSTKTFGTDTLDDCDFKDSIGMSNAIAAANAITQSIKRENSLNREYNNNTNTNDNNSASVMDCSDANQDTKSVGSLYDDSVSLNLSTTNNNNNNSTNTNHNNNNNPNFNNFNNNNGGSMANFADYDDMETNNNNNNSHSHNKMQENNNPPRQKDVSREELLQQAEHHNIDQYLLSWNNFYGNMCRGFHSLQKDEKMVDVTIAAGGKIFKAHKLVLSVCSPYFQKIFLEHPSNHPILFMTGVHSNYMAGLLDFMYSGQVNVKYEDLPNFLKVAEAMQIKGLHNESTSDQDNDPNNNNASSKVPKDLKATNNNNNNNNPKQSNLNFKQPSSPSPYMMESYHQQQQQMLLATQQQQFRNLMTSSPKLSSSTSSTPNIPSRSSSQSMPITSTTSSTTRHVNNASPFGGGNAPTSRGESPSNLAASKYQIHSTSKTMLDNQKHQKYFSKRKLSSINAIADTISQSVCGNNGGLLGGGNGGGNGTSGGEGESNKRHKLLIHHQEEAANVKNYKKQLLINSNTNNNNNNETDDNDDDDSTSTNNNNNNAIQNNNATSSIGGNGGGGGQGVDRSGQPSPIVAEQKIKIEPDAHLESSTSSTTGGNRDSEREGGIVDDEVYYADSPTSNTATTTLSAAAKLRHSILESHLRQNENSAFAGKLNFNRQTS